MDVWSREGRGQVVSEGGKGNSRTENPEELVRQAFGFLHPEQARKGGTETIGGLFTVTYDVEGRTVQLVWSIERDLRPGEFICCYRKEGGLAPDPLETIDTPLGVDLSLVELGEPIIERKEKHRNFRDTGLKEDTKYGYTFFLKRPTRFSDRVRSFLLLPRWGGGDGFRVSELLRFLVHVPIGERTEKFKDAADQLKFGQEIEKGIHLHRRLDTILTGKSKAIEDLKKKLKEELAWKREEIGIRFEDAQERKKMEQQLTEKYLPGLKTTEERQEMLDEIHRQLSPPPEDP